MAANNESAQRGLGGAVRRARFAVRALRRRVDLGGGETLSEGSSLSLDLTRDSSTLLIAFGGMRGARIGTPAFEFSAATERLPVKRVFVRDLGQAWYHRGAPEFGATLASVADGLGQIVEQHGVQRLVTAGNSAGGYAALAFGTLLGADEVLAFAPQTVLELDVLENIGDHRWDAQLLPLIAEGALDRSWSDLRVAIARERRDATRYTVLVDERLDVDRRHAERLVGLPALKLLRFGRGGHGLVRELRQAGALERLLRRALDIELPAAHDASHRAR